MSISLIISKKARFFAPPLILLILLAGAPPRPAGGQEAARIDKPLQYEVSVVLKLVHVFVTDKKGKPVPDLTRDDFAVTDDGQPVAVTDFETHLLQAPAEAVEAGGPAPQAPAPAKAAPQAAKRKFFMFFDFAYNNIRGVAKARRAALHFLESDIRPGDEVAVLSLSPAGGVVMHEYLTSDHAQVRKSVEAIGRKDLSGRANEIENNYWRLVQEGIRQTRMQGDALLMWAESPMAPLDAWTAANQRQETKSLARKFMLQMTDLAKALRLVPGQKHFLFFSTGIPNSLIYGSVPSNARYTGPDTMPSVAGDMALRDLNEAMYKEFTTAGCMFYAFDTRESAKTASLFDYDEQTFLSSTRQVGTALEPTDMFKVDRETGLDSLKRFSDTTGGKYYSNIDQFQKNMDQVQMLTGTYYVLGYSLSEKEDGRFHEVKVEVKRKGCVVRAQAGYFNPKPFREYTNGEKQIHLFDLALNERSLSRMPAGFSMTALPLRAGPTPGLEIVARIPGEIVEKFAGKRVEIITFVFDGRGNIRGLSRMEADPGLYRGRALVYAAGQALEPGNYKCRLILRDMDTGLSAVGSARGVVGPPPAALVLALGAPLLLVRGSGAALLEAPSGRAKGLAPWTDIYPFDRLEFSPVAGEVPAVADKVRIVVPCSVPGTMPPDLTLGAYLIHSATGRRMAVPVAFVGRTQWQATEIFNLEFSLNGLDPGAYLLYIHAASASGKAMAHVQTAFTIPRR